MEKEFLCKSCGSPLNCEDVLDTSGGILEGYINEHQVWSCPECQKDFIIDLYIDIHDFEITYFEES